MQSAHCIMRCGKLVTNHHLEHCLAAHKLRRMSQRNLLIYGQNDEHNLDGNSKLKEIVVYLNSKFSGFLVIPGPNQISTGTGTKADI